MRAVVIDGAGSVRVNTQPDPALPGPDGVVVAVTAAGICGSDLHFYEGEYPFTEPVALGHEAVGTIVEAGPQVRTVGVGDLVMVSSVAGCGVCPGCETHDPVMCFSGPMIFGAGVLGGAQADLLAVPAADFQVLKIPEGITTEQALLAHGQPRHRLGGSPTSRYFIRLRRGGHRPGSRRPLRAAQRLHTRCRNGFRCRPSKGTLATRGHLGCYADTVTGGRDDSGRDAGSRRRLGD